MKKILWLLLLSTLLFNGCRKDKSTDQPKIPELPKEGVLVTTSVFGRIVDEQDKPLSGVSVSGGGKTANTDANGIFMLMDVQLDQARAYIKATKPGFFLGSRIFQPVKNGMSKPTSIKLLAMKSIGTINANTGGAAESNGIKIEIPAGAIENYTGSVNVVANYVNPTSPDFMSRMPGDLAADNADNVRGALISYGMSNLDLLDNNGNKLKIKAGKEVTVTLPVPQKLQASATPTIDMWYFDEIKGIWKQEGKGTYSNGKYTGKVTHFSVWNYDHWNPVMILPMILRWMLSNITSMPPDEVNNIVNNPPTFVLQVLDKKTKTTLYTNTFPPPVPNADNNPPGGTSTVTFPLPQMTDVMEVTVMPVQPGGPDYPTNPDYTPTGGETPPPAPTFTDEGQSVTIDVTPTNPPSTITITVPPPGGGGGGNGETVVNVNGKAVNCDNNPVRTGYAYLSMRSGNTIVRSTTAPVYGSEGRFTVQYVFMRQPPSRIDNVVLTVYDVASGKKSQDTRLNVNPSVAHMIQEPVKVCDNPGPNPSNEKIFPGDYVIGNAAQLKTFIDSGYTTVTGSLYISYMSDLSEIVKLKKVWGLQVVNNNITSLGGLAEIEEMSYLKMTTNNQLVTATFPKLTTKAMHALHINNNLSLVSLTLPFVESFAATTNGNISISGNPLFKTLSMPNLKSVDKCGNIEIVNTLFPNLNMFANASGTLGSWGLTLNDNPELTSVSGFKNIVITGRLSIDQCIRLPTLEGMNIQPDVTDWVTITRNDKLTDITAVSGKLKSTAGLTVSSNKLLTTANFPLFEKGSVACKENEELTSLTMPKFKESNHINLTHNIKLATINMNALEKVVQGFYLWGGFELTQALTSFDLPALKSAGSSYILNCPGIVNLDGFNNWTETTGEIVISNSNFPGANVKLKTIDGFNKLVNIPASLGLESASGSDYKGPLQSIKGFKALKKVGGSFNIGGRNLSDASGFSNLENVFYDIRIMNTALTNVNSFGKLADIGADPHIARYLFIHDNEKLTTLKGFASLAIVKGISIQNNKELVDIDGLENIKSAPLGFSIVNNEKLTNINGVSNVEGSIAHIYVNLNKILKNLCGATKALKGGGHTGVFQATGNAYNPTKEQIIAGQCSQ